MALSLLQRLVAAVRRPPPAEPAPAPDAPLRGGARRRSDEVPGIAARRPTLSQLTAAVPSLRDELVLRSRGAGLLVGWVAVLVTPAWTFADRFLAPDHAGAFLAVRLLCDVPMLAAMYVLWRRPLDRQRPERPTFAILAVLQAEIAWMIPQVSDVHFYLMGYTIAVYASGCILVTRPRWTARLIALSWAALGVSVLLSQRQLSGSDLVSIALFLGTASLVSQLAHVRRYALSTRELVTRVRLEHEQQRSQVLLARLERLSHEDSLTGLANRRRWDAELADRCAQARDEGSVLAVVLVDLDHFKDVNDRHGHAGGDEALRQVSRLLRGRVRAGDLVARLGGDELAVLLPGADVDRAVILAEELRCRATGLRPAGFAPGELSLSIGVAAAWGRQAVPAELMSRADEQLYRAKTTRNAVGAAPRTLPHPVIPQDAALLHTVG